MRILPNCYRSNLEFLRMKPFSLELRVRLKKNDKHPLERFTRYLRFELDEDDDYKILVGHNKVDQQKLFFCVGG